jgi:hypothetical protein
MVVFVRRPFCRHTTRRDETDRMAIVSYHLAAIHGQSFSADFTSDKRSSRKQIGKTDRRTPRPPLSAVEGGPGVCGRALRRSNLTETGGARIKFGLRGKADRSY